MKGFRWFAGIVLLAAGAAGLVASLIAVFGVRDASGSLARQTDEILGSTVDAVVFLKRGTTKIESLLGETSTHAKALDATLASIARKVKNSPTGKTLLDALDQSIAQQLQRAQATVTALQNTLDAFQGTLVLFHSLPGAAKQSPSKGDQKGEAADLPQALLEASDILDRLSQFLNEVLTNREVSRATLNRLLELVEQIQVRLGDAEARVGEFQQRLRATEERIAASRATLPDWIDKGSAFAMILLICFAFTQIGLMLQARGLLGKS